MDELRIGLIGESITTVTQEMTARAVGSGSLDVYATPSMVALMEAAAVAALDSWLSAGKASVGISITVQHLSATPIGESVTAMAEITEIEGRRVTFEVRAWDEHDLIGEGTHVRYVIDADRFMARVDPYLRDG